MQSITIIGVGRVGGALAIALERSGIEVESLVYRGSKLLDSVRAGLSHPVDLIPFDSFTESKPGILIIASGDSDIASIAFDLVKCGISPNIALHTSGSRSSEELNPLREAGSSVGSLHPLVSISEPGLGSKRFSEAYFCVEGDEPAREAASEIAAALGGHPFSIRTEDKPLYHAAAVTAAGHLTALIDVAIRIMTECGLEPEESQKILHPLITSTVANLAVQKPVDALTGPFARGDAGTFKRHMKAFDGRVQEEFVNVYLELASRSVELILEKTPTSQLHRELSELIYMAKQKTGC